MRRSASEVIKNLETRIARLEGKTASSMSVRAFNAEGDAVSPYKKVECELTPRGIASCIKREFGCDADTTNIKLWVGYGNDATEIKVPCTRISGEIAYVCIYLVYGAEYSIF